MICIHKDLDPKTAQAIEHDAVPELEASGIITPDAPDLTRETGEPAVTSAFDREGQRPALFLRPARRGVACITWHKNFQGRDWSREDFRDYEMPVHGPAGRSSATVSLAEKTVSLKNGPEARQIRRRLENGRQVTLITTHPSMPVEEAAGAMFSRWSQENFFKYMRGEFNLDALPAHTLMPLDPRALTVNPARRAADKAAEALRARIRRLSRRILQCRKNGKPCESLDAEAESLENELEELKLRRRRLPARIRAGDLPESRKLDALPVAGRLFLDIIRMICYRAETRMMPPVAAAQGRKPAPRKLLAALMTADADILPDHENGILRVRILGLAGNAADKALMPLLDQLNRTGTLYPGTRLRLVYHIAGMPNPENGSDNNASGQEV